MVNLRKVRAYGSMVAFSHTVFALPFAASAVVLAQAEHHLPLTVLRVLALLICMVSARTCAMAFNRYVDRDIDAKNARTRERHIPRGEVRPGEALALTVLSGAAFLATAFFLGKIPAILAPPVLLVLLGYSFAKRFTWAAHAWLGVALSLAPGGAWLALGAPLNVGIFALMVAVVFWLFGFDILYSLQDETFDRQEGLHSVPARFGMRVALVMSALAHMVTVVALVVTGLSLARGALFFVGVFLAAALLLWEHVIVGRGNLARIDKAFFDVNAYVSVGFFVLCLLDELHRREVFS